MWGEGGVGGRGESAEADRGGHEGWEDDCWRCWRLEAASECSAAVRRTLDARGRVLIDWHAETCWYAHRTYHYTAASSALASYRIIRSR